MEIHLENFFNGTPLSKQRKLLKYVFQEPWRNENTIKVLEQYLTERMEKHKKYGC